MNINKKVCILTSLMAIIPTAILAKTAIELPSTVLHGSGGKDYRFSDREYKRLINSVPTIKRKMAAHENAINTAAQIVGFDPILIEAIMVTESGAGTNVEGRALCWSENVKDPMRTGYRAKYCNGPYQISAMMMHDAYFKKRKYLRGKVTQLDDRNDVFSGAIATMVALKYNYAQELKHALKNKKTKYSFPYTNMVNLVRAYNGGSGTVRARLGGSGSSSGFKENFQYPYKVAFWYHELGGREPYFVDLLSGRDEYCVNNRCTDGGGEFNLESYKPYKIPTRECKLQNITGNNEALHITNPYGKRFDFNTRKERMHRFVDIDLPVGRRILAQEDGRVIEVKNDKDQGTVLVIDYDNLGVAMSYGSLQSTDLKAGQRVKKGQVIAKTGERNSQNKPLLILGYFDNNKASLSLNEKNDNLVDPLSVFCQEIKVPEEMLLSPGALPNVNNHEAVEDEYSLSGVLESMVLDRVGNKKWLEDIAIMSKPRLYAEMAYQQMISLAISQRTKELKERDTAINATSLSLIREKVINKNKVKTRQDTINTLE